MHARRTLQTRSALMALVLAVASVQASSQDPNSAEGTSRLMVSVTDAPGEPVEGAVVVARPAAGGGLPFGGTDPERVRAGVTNAEGLAVLESLPPGPWTVAVLARGFAPSTERQVQTGLITVQLDLGGAITGTVADADGVPLSGARVSVGAGLPGAPTWAEQASRVETMTDAEGGFRLEGLGPRPVRLSARAPGYGKATRDDVEAGDHVELFLFPGATLEGTVIDEEGGTIEGALVQAAGGGLFTAALPGERTEADGTFVMAGVEEGEYVVVAREGGRAPGLARVVVEGDGAVPIEIVITAGAFVTGRLTDPEGEPVIARVEAVSFDGVGLPAFAREHLTSDAGDDGTFALGPLPLGDLELEALAHGFSPRRVSASLFEAGTTAELGDVILDRGLSIRGRVADQDGAGVEAALVRAMPRSYRPRQRLEARSREDGSFELGGLDEGLHTLTATKPGYAGPQLATQAGDEAVELVLETGGEIAGRVVTADGQAALDALIRAELADPSVERHERDSALGSVEDDEGRFVLRDVRAGTWILKAVSKGRGEVSVPEIQVVGGRTTDVGTVRLARGGIIRGAVVDSDGVGIPGAAVRGHRSTRSSAGRVETQSGGHGAFEIRGVPAGRMSISASHPRYAASASHVVEVDPTSEPVPVRLTLARGGRIQGTVLHRDGRPFDGGRVMTWALGSDRGPGSSQNGAITPDGWYGLDHVRQGRTRVHVMSFTSRSPTGSGSSNMLTAIAHRDVDVRDGETVALDFPLRDVLVTGQVTRGGQPVRGVLVGLMGDGMMSMHFSGATSPRALSTVSGPQPLTGTTGEDGVYELLAYSPGRFHVALTELSAGQRHPPRQVEVPDVERFELDLEIADSVVSGVLVDAESGEPVSGGMVRLVGQGPERSRGASTRVDRQGRFTLPVETGDYRLIAETPGRKTVVNDVTVGVGGLEDVILEMEVGLEIRGRVVDGRGQPAGGILVGAAPDDSQGVARSESLPDGTFRMAGLADRSYAIAAGSGLAGFAIRLGVRPTEEPLILRLQPGGRVSVRVVDASGRPVSEIWPGVRMVGGVRLYVPGLQSNPTGPDGVAVIDSPSGTVGVEVRHESGRGQGTVNVRPGETASLEITLETMTPPEDP